jgi:hypothetical protein
MTTHTIQIGDRITFRATTRWSDEATTRVVNGFDPLGRPTVRYGGYPDFIVRRAEISKVYPKPKESK